MVITRNSIDAVRRQSAASDSDNESSSASEEEGEKEKVESPPQSSTDNATNGGKDDGDISALTEGLGGVSIASKRRLHEISAPESIKSIAELLSSNKYKNIIILTGAGVSCNAGIPDFRTPGTGLYDNLSKYNLPFPEAVFDLGFYKNNPDPFVQLASELWPGLKHSPTITHSFIALLEKKGLLLRNYTQNIDMLDVLAVSREPSLLFLVHLDVTHKLTLIAFLTYREYPRIK